MKLETLITEAHQNAVDHGFWDEKPDIQTIYCLIHSEWSEALEEARNGRPLVWHNCNGNGGGQDPCEAEDKKACYYYTSGSTGKCPFVDRKPEGIAVELIDGVIRICDLLGYFEYKAGNPDTDTLMKRARTIYPGITKELPAQHLIKSLHTDTSRSADLMEIIGWQQHYIQEGGRLAPLEVAIGKVFVWIEEKGLNPEEILREKMEYNKTRPYKHGKQF